MSGYREPVLRHRRRSAVIAALAAAATGVLPGLPAAAAGGTWGAGAYPYLAGQICTTSDGATTSSSPLVSWDLGTGVGPGFVTSQLTSDGTVDSAAPPLASVGSQTVSDVTPGTSGFTSASDIAAYAALVSQFGSGGSAQVAEVADAVIRKASGVSPGCADTGAESALLAQAQQLAGPYSLTFAARPARVLPGTAATVEITLRSAAGRPVPGATVGFSATGVQLAASSATTDGNGVAAVQVTAPATGVTSQPPLSVTAHAALPTGLQLVNATTAPSATDPTGSVAGAIVTATPPTVSATKTLALNLAAHPVMHLAAPTRALDVGTALDPHAEVTGMYGHKANVVFTIRGPVGLSSRTFCGGLSRSDFGTRVAATSTLTITGDSNVDAGAWSPAQPGCYWVDAQLTTLDAVPQATATASLGGPVAVLDTSVTLTIAHALVATSQPVTGSATVEHGHGLAGHLQVRLRGPVRPEPDATGCGGVDYSKAPVQRLGTRGGADAPTFSAPTAGVGCYQVVGALRLPVPGSGVMRVPIDPSAAPTVLAVDPQVSYAMSKVWSVRSGDVSAQVTVIGTFNQPVHVALRMMHVPNATLDCRSADYTAAKPGPPGAAVAAHANLATVSVHSAKLDQTGCYEPVPVLTMDGNRSITATASFDALTSAVAVGVGPDGARLIDGGTIRPDSAFTLRGFIAGGVFALLCAIAIAYGLSVAQRMSRARFEGRFDSLLDGVPEPPQRS
jgi:hypothetical protein